MNVGDYIRTIHGISKVNEIKPDEKHKTVWLYLDRSLDHCCFLVRKQEVIKSSSNIVDLIETGDYVDGHEVYKVTPNYIFTRGGTNYSKNDAKIETIVTKEQFSSMEYKI